MGYRNRNKSETPWHGQEHTHATSESSSDTMEFQRLPRVHPGPNPRAGPNYKGATTKGTNNLVSELAEEGTSSFAPGPAAVPNQGGIRDEDLPDKRKGSDALASGRKDFRRAPTMENGVCTPTTGTKSDKLRPKALITTKTKRAV